MEFNKIFAAILIAGIIASFSDFLARELVYPKKLTEDAVHVEGVDMVAAADSGPELPEPIMALLAGADLTRGERLARACMACHTFNQGGAMGIGPNLWDTLNRDIGTTPGFAYSNTMAEMGGVWDYEALNFFLWRPRAYVPGTKMNFIGIRSPEDRAAVIAWMRTHDTSPAPLPTEADIAAEEQALLPPPDEDEDEEMIPVEDLEVDAAE